MAVKAEEERIEEWRKLHGRGHYEYTKVKDWSKELLDEKRVLTTVQAAEILQISPATVHDMVERGTLNRIIVGRGRNHKALYSREQVESVAEERMLKVARKSKTPGEWAHDLRHPMIHTTREAPPNDRLIRLAEAAAILGVGHPRITQLVRQGTLVAWQEAPGKPGSKVFLSENQVTGYANDPDRILRRNRLLGIKTEKVEDPRYRGIPTQREYFREANRLDQTDGREPRAIDLDHGEYFSTKQVARELGITRSGVISLRLRGTLMGYRRRPTRGNGSAWWFLLKEDVFNLEHDPEYRRLHDRSVASRLHGRY